MKQSLASWIFENAKVLIVVLFMTVLFVCLSMILAKTMSDNVTMQQAKLAYENELHDAYSKGWNDGFNAFINRAVTTDMVELEKADGWMKYKEGLK